MGEKNTTPDVTFLRERTVKLNSGQELENIHGEEDCQGRPCPLHNPTAHELRGYPLYFNGSHMVRIVGETLRVDPDDYAFSSKPEAILRNALICRHCGNQIESTYRHDFVMCSCGKIFVDGGTSYLLRGGNSEDWIDISVIETRELTAEELEEKG